MRFLPVLLITVLIASTSAFLDSTFESIEKLKKVKIDSNAELYPALLSFLQEQRGRFKAANFNVKVSENENLKFYVVITPENEQKMETLMKSFTQQFIEQAGVVFNVVLGVFAVMALVIILLVFGIVCMCKRAGDRS
ncbi:hypothetical protein L596_010701 [Steinernema carpocapsae]|nr:hypothetical protein L596_010701 [Steinernema carpocapsae]